MITIGTYFSGGGIGLALLPQNFETAFAVEYEQALADVYKLNYSTPTVVVGRVQDVDPAMLPYVDVFQASPVCKTFSQMTMGRWADKRTETDEEFTQAQAVTGYIEIHQPRYVVIENVRAYAKSASWQIIEESLTEFGYKFSSKILNAANYGSPQSRVRFIAVATRSDMPDYIWPQENSEKSNWHTAMSDLLDDCPESQFAPVWQVPLLPENWESGPVFLADGQARMGCSNMTIRYKHELSFTIMASASRKPAKVHLGAGKVVKLTPRCLARLFDMPDSYKLSGKAQTDLKLIGNGIPAKLMQTIYRNMVF